MNPSEGLRVREPVGRVHLWRAAWIAVVAYCHANHTTQPSHLRSLNVRIVPLVLLWQEIK